MADIGITLTEDETFKPGRYADDVPVIVLMLSILTMFVGLISAAIDTWESAAHFLLQAIYLVFLYSHLEKRP